MLKLSFTLSPRVAVLLTVLVSLLAFAAGTMPPHPAPATDATVPVGDGNKWVTTGLVDTSTDQAMTFSSSGNTFNAIQVVEQAVWSTHCPTGTTCSTTSTPYLGGFTPSKTTTIGTVHCTATVQGGTGNLTIHIYDVSSAGEVCNCTLTCENFDRVGETGCSCVGSLAGSKHHVLYVTGDCVISPTDPWCTVNML